MTLNFEIFFALLNSSSSGSTNPANIAINIANPPVLILIFSSVATIPWAPSWTIKTIGIESKKYRIAGPDVKVTPGINTVNCENSVGATKNLETFDSKNQNAKPIIRKPATTLTLAKTLIPRLVRPRIFVRTDCTCWFLYTRLYIFSSKPCFSNFNPLAIPKIITHAIRT